MELKKNKIAYRVTLSSPDLVFGTVIRDFDNKVDAIKDYNSSREGYEICFIELHEVELIMSFERRSRHHVNSPKDFPKK